MFTAQFGNVTKQSFTESTYSTNMLCREESPQPKLMRQNATCSYLHIFLVTRMCCKEWKGCNIVEDLVYILFRFQHFMLIGSKWEKLPQKKRKKKKWIWRVAFLFLGILILLHTRNQQMVFFSLFRCYFSFKIFQSKN